MGQKHDWHRSETGVKRNRCKKKHAAGCQSAIVLGCCFVVVSLLFQSIERDIERIVKEAGWLLSSRLSLCPVSVLFRSSFRTVLGLLQDNFCFPSISIQFPFSFISSAFASLHASHISASSNWTSQPNLSINIKMVQFIRIHAKIVKFQVFRT